MKKSFFIPIMIALVGFSALPGAAPDDPEITAWLTGGSQRVWVIASWRVVLGSDGGCLSGELWTFSSEGQFTKKVCQDGRPVIALATWEVAASEGAQNRVTIDSTVYEIDRLRKEEPGEEGEPSSTLYITIIREVRQSQAEAVREIELHYRDF